MGGQSHPCHFDEQTNVFFTYFNLSFVTGRRDIQMMAFRWNPIARDLRRFPLGSIRRFVVVKTLVGLMFQQTLPEHTRRKREDIKKERRKARQPTCVQFPTRFRGDLPITVHVFHHRVLPQLFPHFPTWIQFGHCCGTGQYFFVCQRWYFGTAVWGFVPSGFAGLTVTKQQIKTNKNKQKQTNGQQMVNHTCAQKEKQRKHLDSLVPVIQMFSLGCGYRFPYLHGLVRGGGNGMDHRLQYWLRQTTTTATTATITATTSEKITGYFPSVFVLGRIVVKRFFGHGVVKFMPISDHLHPSGTLCQHVPEKKQFVVIQKNPRNISVIWVWDGSSKSSKKTPGI